MSDATELPDDVALLWGLRDTPRRGPKPALSSDDIVRAAVAVADADGLGAVSMARVAAELGNATMALYRHVRSKDELLLLMADAAVEGPPDLSGADWRSGLTAWARALVAAVGRHPWYARLPISGPPAGPNNLAWLDSALGVLAPTGLAEAEQLAVVMGVLTYAHGQIRLGLDLAAASVENPDAFGARYGEILARVVDPRRFPALSALMAAGVFDAAPASDPEHDFDVGLELLLDGVAGHIARAVR